MESEGTILPIKLKRSFVTQTLRPCAISSRNPLFVNSPLRLRLRTKKNLIGTSPVPTILFKHISLKEKAEFGYSVAVI